MVNKEIEALKQSLKSQNEEMNQIEQSKEGYVAANHWQRLRIIVLEKDNESLRNERDSIQSQNRSLIQQNDSLKVKKYSIIIIACVCSIAQFFAIYS